ncbi:MAG: ribbon-helix-helix domain-containing protein [Acidimicrobiales bacterium]
MYTPAIRRIQLHLDEELDEVLTRRAFERHMPKAALIREYLAEQVASGPPLPGDPSSNLVGIYEGEAQESANIDAVLYRA